MQNFQTFLNELSNNPEYIQSNKDFDIRQKKLQEIFQKQKENRNRDMFVQSMQGIFGNGFKQTDEDGIY